MSLNVSLFSGGILHIPNNTSINADLPFSHCLILGPSSFIFASYFIAHIIVLPPLCISIIYLGLQKRWKKHSLSTATMMSHSDSFTYHMVIMELMCVIGFILCFFGIFMLNINVFFVGYLLWVFTWHGETFFHILTCLERYLAVVHPITYRNLRSQRGIRIRNICNGCVWLLSLGGSSLRLLENISHIAEISLLFLSLIVITLCSLFVLSVLIGPGPGEQGKERERVDRSKKRAFYSILVILGVVSIRCLQNMSWTFMSESEASECMSSTYGIWCSVPCSLVLPLLFLHRAGKFASCRSIKCKQ